MKRTTLLYFVALVLAFSSRAAAGQQAPAQPVLRTPDVIFVPSTSGQIVAAIAASMTITFK